MKKLLLLLLGVVLSVSTLFACGGKPEAKEPVYYSVTFKQDGQEDIVKVVEEGTAVKDIPTPAEKVGYDVNWGNVDLTNVRENFTVWAVATPKEYTITFDANGGEVATTTMKVVYDTVPDTFPTPTYEGYDFVCWQNGTVVVSNSAVWKTANNITLTAQWVEAMPEQCTITFLQGGGEIEQIVVNKGEGIDASQFPTLSQKTGYTVQWPEIDLSSVMTNITVEAIETPKEYTITFEPNDGSLESLTQTVIYDSSYELPTPKREFYPFIGWKYGSVSMAMTGKWTIDEDITLEAEWGEVEKYTITLSCGKGSIGGEKTKIIELPKTAKVSDLPTPELHKDYYTQGYPDYAFGGWKYDSKILSGDADLRFDTDEVVLTAVWSSLWLGPL